MLRKYTLTIVLLTFCISATFAQAELFDVKLSDTTEYVKTWQKKSNSAYKEIPNSYIDLAVITLDSKKSLDIYLLSNNPTALKFIRITQAIERKFGKPYVSDDYIPDRAKNDPEYLDSLIKLGKAEIIRIYEAKNGDYLLLTWKVDELSVLMSNPGIN